MVYDVGAIRGQVRRTGFRRLTHGLYLPDSRPWTRSPLRHELAAITLVLPAGAGYTHLTAAWLRGWWLPALREPPPVFAAAPGSERPRRPGLVCSRLPTTDVETVRGLPCVSAEETLLRAARDLSLLDLVPMVESALRGRDVTRESIESVAAERRPGVRLLREAAARANPRSESPMETCLRLFHELAGIEVTPQFVIRDDAGREVARADLRVNGTPFLHEYDGDVHASRSARARDLRRDRWLIEAGFVRRGFVAEDLFLHPMAVLQELDRAVGRPHRPRRLSIWRRLVAESAYSEAGRARLHRRWWNPGGLVDWSRTA
jgi:very-short-patch-repair endonuclease